MSVTALIFLSFCHLILKDKSCTCSSTCISFTASAFTICNLVILQFYKRIFSSEIEIIYHPPFMSTLVVQFAWCQNEAGGTGMKIPRSNPFGCWLAGVSLESFSVLKLLFLRSPSSDQPLDVRTIDGRNRASPTRL
ncbi:hypothetical protein MANES_03G037616v8 [Manihot esculenta]|uniref:Uncharacterized protein n=1 Tax=Manihot esculenta TaxID=3983 RepID=A0ACB7HY51_MANES|nr:hypothetical protein MANES_03G037616v8 [Manihot esculenta]